MENQVNTFFQKNKYYKWYFNIIDKAKQRNWSRKTAPVYVESHHIIPKSIVKNKDTVFLTSREHFVCHWLLVKFVCEKHKYKMFKALHKMISDPSKSSNRKLSSKQYEIARKYNSLYMKQNNPAKRSDVRQKMKIAASTRKVSDETKKKMSTNNAKYWLNKNSPLNGSKFYNNGVEQKMFIEGTQPKEWNEGRLNNAWNKGDAEKFRKLFLESNLSKSDFSKKYKLSKTSTYRYLKGL